MPDGIAATTPAAASLPTHATPPGGPHYCTTDGLIATQSSTKTVAVAAAAPAEAETTQPSCIHSAMATTTLPDIMSHHTTLSSDQRTTASQHVTHMELSNTGTTRGPATKSQRQHQHQHQHQTLLRC